MNANEVPCDGYFILNGPPVVPVLFATDFHSPNKSVLHDVYDSKLSVATFDSESTAVHATSTPLSVFVAVAESGCGLVDITNLVDADTSLSSVFRSLLYTTTAFSSTPSLFSRMLIGYSKLNVSK